MQLLLAVLFPKRICKLSSFDAGTLQQIAVLSWQPAAADVSAWASPAGQHCCALV